MILNLVVSAWLAGLAVSRVLQILIDNDVIDINRDDENTWARVNRMLGYTHRFNYDYLIDPDTYRLYGKHIDDKLIASVANVTTKLNNWPVVFELVKHSN